MKKEEFDKELISGIIIIAVLIVICVHFGTLTIINLTGTTSRADLDRPRTAGELKQTMRGHSIDSAMKDDSFPVGGCLSEQIMGCWEYNNDTTIGFVGKGTCDSMKDKAEEWLKGKQERYPQEDGHINNIYDVRLEEEIYEINYITKETGPVCLIKAGQYYACKRQVWCKPNTTEVTKGEVR